MAESEYKAGAKAEEYFQLKKHHNSNEYNYKIYQAMSFSTIIV